MNLLAFDIGNTTISVGLFSDGVLTDSTKMKTELSGDRDFHRESIKAFIDRGGRIDDVIICSVVPALNPVFKEMLNNNLGLEPVFIDHRVDTGIKISVSKPEELGADRLADAVAAAHIYGLPVAVADFGTATTLSVVDGGGRYLGGAIMPGIRLSLEALHKGTAKLPLITASMPKEAVGRDTECAILSGVILGQAGAIERIFKETSAQLGERPKLILTGGFSLIVAPYITGVHELRESLTLEGLKIIHERLKITKTESKGA